MERPQLPVGTRVRVTRDLSFYPVAYGALGTVIAYHGLQIFPWREMPSHCYTVQFDLPHRYGDTLILSDHECEPVD
jgi:hypothetical protein